MSYKKISHKKLGDLKITIDTNNDAFSGGVGMEVARILRKYADKIENSDDLGSALMDINGNSVGSAEEV